MKHDQLIQLVASSTSPVTTVAATMAIGLKPSAETFAAVDLLLKLSPEVSAFADGWTASVNTRSRRILTALRAYAEAHTEKRIFRGTAALGHLPAVDQLTEEELRDLLSKTGEFELLANAMIKRGS